MTQGRRQARELSREQIIRVAEETAINATALLDEANILLGAGRYARAHALAVMALEEFGKHAMTVAALLRSGEPDFWRSYWRRVGDHKEKLLQARVSVQMFGDWDEFDEPDLEDRLLNWAGSRHVRRMTGLYVDVLPDGTVVGPADAISAEEAGKLIDDVRIVERVAEFTGRMLRGANAEGWAGWDEFVSSGEPWDLNKARDIARRLSEGLKSE